MTNEYEEAEMETDDVEINEKEFNASRDDNPEYRTVSSRAQIRTELSSQIEEFLARGGSISPVDAGVTNDPPRKPTSNYGSRPI